MRACLAVAAAFAAAVAAPHGARAAPCALPQASPLWIEYSDFSVPFRNEIFGKPGVVAAVSHADTARELRRRGASIVHWDMYLNEATGTPWAPADPGTIAGRVRRIYRAAARVSGCSTPSIAFNELFGAQLATPWSASNHRYRANVLELLRGLAGRGAHPYLLVSHHPATAGAAGEWWRQLARVADLVREVYVPAPFIASRGPLYGSRSLRKTMRLAVHDFTRIGIPAGRLGFILGFHSQPGTGGRDGLEPAAAWYRVVKLEVLAARAVATGSGVSTIWSWGWQTWSGRPDPDKRVAACVYLWARDPHLCDGPAAAGLGFVASLTEGQSEGPVRPPLPVKLKVAPAGMRRAAVAVAASSRLGGEVLYLQRRVARSQWGVVRTIRLGAGGYARVHATLPSGWWALRVARSPSQTGSLYAGKLAPVRFVRIR